MKRLSLDFSRQDYLAMPERSAGARLRKAVTAFELALATLLLIGAGLLIRSLANLERVQLGFTSHGLITFQLGPPTSKYPVIGKGPMLYRGLLEALQSIPGVRGASVSSGIPFGAGNYTRHPMFITGPSVFRPSTLVPIDWINPAGSCRIGSLHSPRSTSGPGTSDGGASPRVMLSLGCLD